MLSAAENLISALAKKLIENKWTLATAESCTGGGLSFYLTSIAGASAWFERGFVTYSNAAKTNLLGVTEALLEQYGAVSKECALAMAGGGLENSTADLCIAITGIAGPDGGTKEKPVGTVWLAIAAKNHLPYVHLHHFPGNRQTIREATIMMSLEMLITHLNQAK